MRALIFSLYLVLPFSFIAQYVGPPMTTVELGILDQTSQISKKKFSADKVCTEDKSYCYEAIAMKDTAREKWMGEIVQFRIGNNYVPTDEDKIYTGIKITNDKNEEMNLMGTSSLKHFSFEPGNFHVPRNYSKLFSSSGDYTFENAKLKYFEQNNPSYEKYTIETIKVKTLAAQKMDNMISMFSQHYDDQYLEIVKHRTNNNFTLRRYNLLEQNKIQELELEFSEPVQSIYCVTESEKHITVHYFNKEYKARALVLHNYSVQTISSAEDQHTLALFLHGEYWYKIATPKGEKAQLLRSKRLNGEYEKLKEIPEALESHGSQPYYFNSENDTMKLGKSQNFIVFNDYSIFKQPHQVKHEIKSRDFSIEAEVAQYYSIDFLVQRNGVEKKFFLERGGYGSLLPMYKKGETTLIYMGDYIAAYKKRKDSFTFYAMPQDFRFSNYRAFQVGKYYYNFSGGKLNYIDFSEIKLPL